ncbi:MAG: hypothetical protein FJ265_08545 [Planctomycetes bacterium]|nr:hypothetical protein [Planctomycetota bacterium]
MKVLSVDVARQRIALSMKLHEKVEGGGTAGGRSGGGARPGADRRPGASAPRDFGSTQQAANPLAAQLARLGRKGQ